MESSTQIDVYGTLVARYEALYEQGNISDQELAFIKSARTIEDVLKHATESMVSSEFTRNAKAIAVADVGLQKLERVSGSVQILIQADPTLSALVVGSLDFFMKVARDVFNALDRAVELFEVIAVSLQRFGEYMKLFPGSKLLQDLLQQVYIDIVDFCLEALKFYDRGKTRTFGAALWKSLSGPFDGLLKRIARHVSDIDNIAKVEEMKANKEGREMLKDIMSEIENISINKAPKTVEDAGTMFRVPALLHPKFTGRRDALEKMKEYLFAPREDDTVPRRMAIYGLPGAGKTQIALKYAHENRAHYPQVFHAFAATRERLAMKYAEWVRSMDLRSSRGGNQEQKVDAMRNWFESNDGWLLILDNVAGPGVADFPISDFLPAGSTGTIIFTTRNEFVARGLASEGGDMPLERMDSTDAVDLILKTAGIKAPTEEVYILAKEIQEELGGLPMALEQAGTAINDLDGTLSPREYLERLKNNKIELLAQPNGFSVTGSNTVSATFNGVLQGCSPDAVLLLELFSFLDPEGIPTDLLREGIYGLQLVEAVKRHPSIVSIASSPLKVFTANFGHSQKKPEGEKVKRRFSWFGLRRSSTSSSSSSKKKIKSPPLTPSPPTTPPLPTPPLPTTPPPPPTRRSRITSLLSPENVTRLEGVIRELKSSSLLRLNRRDYWIHDLVREFSFKRLQPPEIDEMLSCVIDLVAAAFPLIDSEDQRTNNCNKYRTTAQAVIAMTITHGVNVDTPALWELKHRLARHFWHLGLHEEAEPMAYVAYQRRKEKLGEKHELTMASASLLGNIWVVSPREGEEENVIPFWVHLCKLVEEVHGPVAEFTLTCKLVLGICYRREWMLDEAIAIYVEQIAIVNERFGAKSEKALQLKKEQVIVMWQQEKYDEADALSLEVWKDCFTTLGNDHRTTLSAADARGMVLDSLDRELEVAGMMIISWKKNVALYSAQHPDALSADQMALDSIWRIIQDTQPPYPDVESVRTVVREECRRIMELSGDTSALAEFEGYEAMLRENVDHCWKYLRETEVEGVLHADSGYEEGEGPQKTEKDDGDEDVGDDEGFGDEIDEGIAGA